MPARTPAQRDTITDVGLHLRTTNPIESPFAAVRLRTDAAKRFNSAGQIIPFIQKSISEGASIITDGWRGSAGLKSLGYEHTTKNIKRSGVPAHELLSRVHRVASLLKRWFLGTLQGGVQRRHYYLDEFTFRFNRCTSRSRGLLFYRLMQQVATTDSVSYKRLLEKHPTTICR